MISKPVSGLVCHPFTAPSQLDNQKIYSNQWQKAVIVNTYRGGGRSRVSRDSRLSRFTLRQIKRTYTEQLFIQQVHEPCWLQFQL